jgi:hypothetical protein
MSKHRDITIKYLKSCKGQIKISDMVFNNTELLRMIKLSDNNTHNTYLETLINNSICIGTNEINSTGEQMYYIETELINFIRSSTEFFYNVSRDKLHGNISEKDKFCEITSKQDELYKQSNPSCSSYYFDNLLAPMKKINFTIGNHKFKIIPEFGEYNTFNPYIQDELNRLVSEKNVSMDIIKNILYNLHFTILITLTKSKSDTPPISIYDFHKRDDVLDKIIDNIKQFYKSNYFNDTYEILLDEIYIAFVNDYFYNCVVIRFNLYDSAIQNSYINHINYYRFVPIENMYEKYEHLSYFNLIPGKDAKDKRCVESDVHSVDFHTDPKNIKFETNPKKLSDILGITGKKITIINDFYTADKYHSYCSQFFLVKIDEKYYEISIKSVTMIFLLFIHNGTVKKLDDFYNKYINILREFPFNMHNAKLRPRHIVSNTDKMIIVFDKLPAILEVYIKEKEKPNMIVRMFVDETRAEYDEMIQTYKNLETIPDLSLLIHLFWKSEYRRHFGELDISVFFKNLLTDKSEFDRDKQLFLKLTDVILENPILTSFMIGNSMFSEKYIIVSKTINSNLIILIAYIYGIKLGYTQYNLDKIHELEKKLATDWCELVKFKKISDRI